MIPGGIEIRKNITRLVFLNLSLSHSNANDLAKYLEMLIFLSNYCANDFFPNIWKVV